MKLKIMGLIFVLLIAGMFMLVGCGDDADDTAVEPVEPTDDNGEEREQVRVTIVAARPGDSWNVLSHALASFINQQSDFVRAEVLPSAGVADATRTVMGDDEMRKNSVVVTMLPGADIWGEEVDPYYYPKKIASIQLLEETWVTYDPDIKTIADFEGKTIALPRDVPFLYTWLFANWIDLHGVEDYNLVHGGIGARVDALRDGAADIATMPFDFYYPDEFDISGEMMELEARGTLYFPNQGNVAENVNLIAEACKTDPFEGEYALPTLAKIMPPGSLGEEQAEELAYVSTPIYWAAGEEVDEDIVYEITRIIYEHARSGAFVPYHAVGKGVTEEFVRTSFWITEEEQMANYHPGALRFYQDNDLELRTYMD